MELGTSILLLIGMIFLSAFFSGVETALFSLSDLRVKHLAEKKRRGAETLERLKSNPHPLLITILIGNNLVNIGASSFATITTIQALTAMGFSQAQMAGIATGIMTLIILIFGEITPKTLATTYNEQISLFVARPMSFLTWLFTPLTKVFDVITIFFNKVLGGAPEKPEVTEEEIKTMVRVGATVGEINEREREMIHNVFRFDDIPVEMIMTPRRDIFMIEASKTLKQVINQIIKHNYSRIPVYEKNRDNIIGFILLKDIISRIKNNKLDIKVKKLIKTLHFIPETKKLDTLLRRFQRQKQQMAIVVDEHGAVRGLVTLEDLLEEIVGEIVDETERIEPVIKKLKDKEYLVMGKAEIDEINKRLKIAIPGREYDAISGYVLRRMGHLPKEGEKVRTKRFDITVKKVMMQRIEEVVIKVK